MNQHNIQFAYAALRTVLMSTVAAAILFTVAPAMAAAETDEGRTEARIFDMHAKLKITAAEEDQWAKVAAMMRDNAKEMDQLTSARMKNAESMDAVDDLKSYGEIAEAHAIEIRNFTPVFATLYDSLSDSQKTEADEIFRHGDQHKNHHSKT